jgi:hypothetical protein
MRTGPTIAPDGTVLLGTLQGKVIALRPNGSAYWNRQLPDGQTIASSPVVGSDESVYVVGWRRTRDHRGLPGGASVEGDGAWLHTFTVAGAAPANGTTAFPQFDFGPAALGSPNVWRFGNDEAIIVPHCTSTALARRTGIFVFPPPPFRPHLEPPPPLEVR